MKRFGKMKRVAALFLCVMLCVTGISFGGETGVRVQAAGKIAMSQKNAYVTKGDTLQLKVSGTTGAVSWSSSKKTVASVDNTGVVKALKTGVATITAKVGGKKCTCKVTVETPSISKKKASVSAGKTLVLKVNNTKQKVVWSTDKKSVATVSQKGVVKGIQKGTATITAKVGSKKYNCKVTVTKSIPLKSIAIDQTSITLEEGEDTELTVIYNPGNTTDSKTIKWTSSDTDVVDIPDEDGWIVGDEPGTATLTARVGKFKATCKVTVVASDEDDDDYYDDDDYDDDDYDDEDEEDYDGDEEDYDDSDL